MKKTTILSIILIFSLFSNITADQKSPDFTLRNLDGGKFNLYEQLETNPVLIDFWATWCKPCIRALPHLNRIYDLYSEKGLNVYAISVDNPKSRSKVKPFVKSKGYKFSVLLDSDQSVRKLFGGTSIPLTLLIDQSGEIVYRHLGYVAGDENKLIEEIEKLLNVDEDAKPDTTTEESKE